METILEGTVIGIVVAAAINALAAWGFVLRGRQLDRQFARDATELRRTPAPTAPQTPHLRLVTGEVTL